MDRLAPGMDGFSIYDELPEAIKGDLSHKEWLWLSDRDKATLIQRETEPDSYSD